MAPCQMQGLVDRLSIFFSVADYHFYNNALEEVAHHYGYDVYAIVLMTKDVCLLLTSSNEVGSSRVTQTVGRH